MELTFVPASAQDIDALYSFSKALIDDYEDLESIDYEKVLAWVRRKIGTHIESYTCVYHSGEKAGYYRFVPRGKRMEIDDLYLFPEFRNQGIGTEIIKKCCAEMDKPVMLYVFTRNSGAVALYSRLGFRVTETIGASRCIMIRDPEQEES